MGTYDTIGGTPRHNPEFDIDIPHCCEGCEDAGEDCCNDECGIFLKYVEGLDK